MVYDVREGVTTKITEIIFAEKFDASGGNQAYRLTTSTHRGIPYVVMHDEEDVVIINSVEHANNLKKALDKAIELGWVV